jgi:hypothetical protein
MPFPDLFGITAGAPDDEPVGAGAVPVRITSSRPRRRSGKHRRPRRAIGSGASAPARDPRHNGRDSTFRFARRAGRHRRAMAPSPALIAASSKTPSRT